MRRRWPCPDVHVAVLFIFGSSSAAALHARSAWTASRWPTTLSHTYTRRRLKTTFLRAPTATPHQCLQRHTPTCFVTRLMERLVASPARLPACMYPFVLLSSLCRSVSVRPSVAMCLRQPALLTCRSLIYGTRDINATRTPARSRLAATDRPPRLRPPPSEISAAAAAKRRIYERCSVGRHSAGEKCRVVWSDRMRSCVVMRRRDATAAALRRWRKPAASGGEVAGKNAPAATVG